MTTTTYNCQYFFVNIQDSFFFLPFRLSPVTNDTQFRGLEGDKILHKPTTANNGKAQLFLRFGSVTQHIIRVIVLYKQASTVAIDSNGHCWKSFDLDQ